jgi:predicted DsbA family dithiol-disulfide isomerase
MMAMESDLITADVVEAGEFPEIAQRYQVYAVPKIVFNDAVAFEGNRPQSAFVSAIEQVTRKEDAESEEG